MERTLREVRLVKTLSAIRLKSYPGHAGRPGFRGGSVAREGGGLEGFAPNLPGLMSAKTSGVSKGGGGGAVVAPKKPKFIKTVDELQSKEGVKAYYIAPNNSIIDVFSKSDPHETHSHLVMDEKYQKYFGVDKEKLDKADELIAKRTKHYRKYEGTIREYRSADDSEVMDLLADVYYGVQERFIRVDTYGSSSTAIETNMGYSDTLLHRLQGLFHAGKLDLAKTEVVWSDITGRPYRVSRAEFLSADSIKDLRDSSMGLKSYSKCQKLLSSKREDKMNSVEWIITVKHLQGKHDQRDHAPKGSHPSSLDKILTGKTIGGRKVSGVFKEVEYPKSRMVIFEDGSQKRLPSALLAKMVYGKKGGGPGAPHKTNAEARKNGFVSVAQAAYLKNNLPDVYDQIRGEVTAGTRYWDDEAGKMVMPARKKTIKEITLKADKPKKKLSPKELADIADDDFFLKLESESEN